MIRESKHTLKFTNKGKVALLDRLFADYKIDLQNLIDLIWIDKLELKTRMSSKKIPKNIIQSGQYRALIYNQASRMIRSILNKKVNKFKTKGRVILK